MFTKLFCSRTPFGFKKITTNPQFFAHVNTEFADDKYSNLKIYISKLTLDSYKYITVAYITLTLINMTVIHFVGTEVS